MSPELPPMPLHVDPLPYEARLDIRPLASVDLVVIHCTELPTLADARKFGEQVLYETSGTGNSGHFYIDRDGSLHQYVDPARIAHHTRGFNPQSIGIELVNTGRFPHWLDTRHQDMDEPYPDAQITALVGLLLSLPNRFPALQFIAGHEDLDTSQVESSDDPGRRVPRKRDPGPLFPWTRVMRSIGLKRLYVQ